MRKSVEDVSNSAENIGGGGVLIVSITRSPSSKAPSVLVPPTSIPMRLMGKDLLGRGRIPSLVGRRSREQLN